MVQRLACGRPSARLRKVGRSSGPGAGPQVARCNSRRWRSSPAAWLASASASVGDGGVFGEFQRPGQRADRAAEIVAHACADQFRQPQRVACIRHPIVSLAGRRSFDVAPQLWRSVRGMSRGVNLFRGGETPPAVRERLGLTLSVKPEIRASVCSNQACSPSNRGVLCAWRMCHRISGDGPRMPPSIAYSAAMRCNAWCARGDCVAACTSKNLRRTCVQHVPGVIANLRLPCSPWSFVLSPCLKQISASGAAGRWSRRFNVRRHRLQYFRSRHRLIAIRHRNCAAQYQVGPASHQARCRSRRPLHPLSGRRLVHRRQDSAKPFLQLGPPFPPVCVNT